MVGRRHRHPADRRAQAHHIAEAGRVAQRAAHVRAIGQRDHARGQRRRAAAAAAAGRDVVAVRVARGAEHGVEGVRAGAELRQVGLAQHDGARRALARHHRAVLRRHEIPVHGGPEGSAHVRAQEGILVRHRQAKQRPRHGATRQRRVGRIGRGQRLVERGGDDGVDGRVDALDARDMRVHDFAHAQLAAADGAGHVHGAQVADVFHEIGLLASLCFAFCRHPCRLLACWLAGLLAPCGRGMA